MVSKTGNVRTERSYNNFCHGKAISIEYYEFVCVVLVIQHEERMRRIVMCGLFGIKVIFPLYLKRHDFRRKIIERKICFLIFSASLSEIFLSLRRIQRDITINTYVFMLSVRYSFQILMELFATDFRKKNAQI